MDRKENLPAIVSTDHGRPRIRHYKITTEVKALLNTVAGVTSVEASTKLRFGDVSITGDPGLSGADIELTAELREWPSASGQWRSAQPHAGVDDGPVAT
jgi:hypothetical protein